MEGILLVLVFVTSFLILMSFSLWMPPQKESIPPQTIKGFLREGNEVVKSILIRKKKNTKKKEILEQNLSVAGVPLKAEEFIAFQGFAVLIFGGLFYLISQSIVLVPLGAAIGIVTPNVWLKGKQRKRVKAFNANLPGMITSIIGSLRAGFSFLQSLQMVSEESYSPIKEEVSIVLKTMQYGTSLEDALNQWKNRMPSENLGLLVEAILIQRQVGGNLAYLLDKIVETTRERTKIENQIKTLTAQGRLSGVIISLLPVALGLIIYLMNPDYIGTLFVNPIGQGMLVAAFLGGIIGFVLIRKITTIEV